MQSITNISKLLLAAFAITCSIFLLWNTVPFSVTIYDAAKDANIQEILEARAEKIADAEKIVEATILTTAATNSTSAVTKVEAPQPILVTKKTTTATTIKPAASMWANIGSQLNLNHQANTPQVKAEIRKILADKTQFYNILKAAGPYLYFINSQIQQRHLPAELALIPIIESEFNPNDHSNKGALGLWQLMPQTARELGVKVTGGYDGRRNVIASTKAALAYFNDLGKLFKGNWYLAMAAYNCGQVKVQSAIKRYKTTNFWQLSLPRETKLYVPKLLAVAAIIKNPQQYGIKLPVISNQPFFAEKKIEKPVTLKKYAQTSGLSEATLKALNPDHKSGTVNTKTSKSFLVPVKI